MKPDPEDIQKAIPSPEQERLQRLYASLNEAINKSIHHADSARSALTDYLSGNWLPSPLYNRVLSELDFIDATTKRLFALRREISESIEADE
jgi:hypothetical protein